ncbi:MAG: hypothetical protein JXR96_15560 [Deltaproteobacteria bacterium]|nr:hypothetical protein [Deltaproteobacteria bacterium]
MIVGTCREIKEREYRVALLPDEDAVAPPCELGHPGERGAGQAAGFDDAEYTAAGAELVEEAAFVYARSELVYKVKEPLQAEYGCGETRCS